MTETKLLKSGELLEPPYYPFMQQAIRILHAHERHVLQLEPEFYSDFACSSCGLCCQRPWSISLSREYYDCWHEEFNRHPSGRYRDPFEVLPTATDEHYANIRRKPGTSECIFLTEDKRCFIHATYGEEALSDVCRDFPRYEGWFGAFLGRFMLGSCPDVLELAQRFPKIRYEIVTVQPEKWQNLHHQFHPMGLYQGFLWLGLQLDLISDLRLTPIQSMRNLARAMRLLPAALGQVDEALLSQLHESLSRQPAVPAQTEQGQAYACLSWYLEPLTASGDYLKEIASGRRALPVLQAEEQALLNAFLRNYLAYRLLTANFYAAAGLVAFYPFYFQLAVHLGMLQWLALSYREREAGGLSREQLLRAANVIAYRYEHAAGYRERLEHLGQAVCIEGMESLLSFDFGSPA